jgi:cytidylate kinase
VSKVVCISRAIGAGGDQIGRGVAERLGFRFIDDGIIREASRLSGEDADLIADAERRKGFLERALNSMASSGAGGMGYEASVERFNPPRNAEVLIREAINAVASQGNVVIGAHAAAMQLGGSPDIVRALITASDATRIARIRDEVGLDEKAAAKVLRESDKARTDYFRRFYDISNELPVHYDLIVNTDHVSFDQAIGLIVTLAD